MTPRPPGYRPPEAEALRGVTARPLTSPGWGRGRPAGGIYWTKSRVAAALRLYAATTTGPLTTSDHEWSALKKGRLDLPTAGSILTLWRSMRRAWLAVGIDRSRVPALNTRWSKAEKAYLLEHAGTLTLERIAKDLDRSYASVKTMIGSKGMGITARANNGYWSAAQVAKEYGAPYERVLYYLRIGRIKAHRHGRRQSWQIDLEALTPAVIAALKGPKITHKTTPTDLGDYRQRYGIIRSVRPAAAVLA